MRARPLMLLVGAVAALALAAWAVQRERRVDVGVTAAMAGRWVTADERWAGRFLEIGPGEIVFGQGPEGEARYRITSVLAAPPTGGTEAYAIRYREPGDPGAPESELALRLAPGELRLASRPDVRWVRAAR